MIRKLLLCSLVSLASLSLFPERAQAQTAKYDLFFRRWGAFYFPWDDWRWWKAQGIAESRLDPRAVSWCGASGIMQLMPATASQLGAKDRNDPESSIQAGVHYDRELWDGWHAIPLAAERRRFTFAAYNAGPGNIRRAHSLCGADEWSRAAEALPRVTGRHAEETVGYVQHIERFFSLIQH